MASTSKRITFTEDFVKQKLSVPPCTKYFPKKTVRVLLGKCNDGVTGDYMSEVEFLALQRPPSNFYDPKVTKKSIILRLERSHNLTIIKYDINCKNDIKE